MKQTIIWVSIVAAIVGVMLWARPAGSSSAPPADVLGGFSAFSSSEKLFDFGTIRMTDGDVTHVFKLTNNTDKDIEIKVARTSCMCTNAFLKTSTVEKGPFGMQGMGYVPPANEIVKAGESMDVKVVYNPNAHGPAGVGFIDRFIYLTDAAGRTLQFEIKAIVTP